MSVPPLCNGVEPKKTTQKLCLGTFRLDELEVDDPSYLYFSTEGL